MVNSFSWMCVTSFAYLSAFSTVVKQRMQVHGSKFRSVPETFKTVYRTEGLGAFYVSYPTTLTMTVPFTAVQFSTYEFLKYVHIRYTSGVALVADHIFSASQGEAEPFGRLLSLDTRHSGRYRRSRRCRCHYSPRRVQDFTSNSRYFG